MQNLSISFLDSIFLAYFFSLTFCTVLNTYHRADVSHWIKLQVIWGFFHRVETHQIAGTTERKGLPIAPFPATTLLLLKKGRQPAALPPHSLPLENASSVQKGQRKPRTCSNAGKVNYFPSDIPSFSSSPPIQVYFPSLLSSSHTPLRTLLQQRLTKTLPLLIPPLLEIGTPRELVDKFHSSCEFLFTLSITEWWKYCRLPSCLSWHPITSFSQAFSLPHCLNIQLCFKSTSRCSSFVVVYLRCCSMFMECSFTGKIPWPKPSKGTTHLGSIFHDTWKALTFWEGWFPQSGHKTSLKYLKLGNKILLNWNCTWPVKKAGPVCQFFLPLVQSDFDMQVLFLAIRTWN